MIETSQLPMDSDGGSLRGIAVRINGDSRGGITRLLSPSSWGELLKPFVFLDYFELHADSMAGFQPHPHSGIATHTTFLDGGMSYGDSTGMSGTMSPGTIEWMQAGRGVWHWGKPSPGSFCRGYQLWIALPPELELSEAMSQHVPPDKIDTDGKVRVLLGQYGSLRSPIQVPLQLLIYMCVLATARRGSIPRKVSITLRGLRFIRDGFEFPERLSSGSWRYFMKETHRLSCERREWRSSSLAQL